MDAQGLFDLRSDAQQGIETRHRLLKHDTAVFAVDRAKLAATAAEQIAAFKQDFSRHLNVTPLDQSGQRHRRYRFAGTGLADEAKPFTTRQRQRNPLDGLFAG